jgi:hypothetical protein
MIQVRQALAVAAPVVLVRVAQYHRQAVRSARAEQQALLVARTHRAVHPASAAASDIKYNTK